MTGTEQLSAKAINKKDVYRFLGDGQ